MFLFLNPRNQVLLNFFKSWILWIFIVLSFVSPVIGAPISSADRKLLSAAINGNLRLAKAALDQGASVNARDPRQYFLGETPLHKVVLNNDVSFLRFLLSRGADPNLSDDRGETPLITAVYGLSLESLSVLIQAKADLNAETKSGLNAAIVAADLCSLPTLKILKKAGVNFNQSTRKRLFPILAAVKRCNSKFIQYLIDAGASIDSATNTGLTPLMHALKQGNLEIVPFLLEQGASVQAQDKYGNDAMYYLFHWQFSAQNEKGESIQNIAIQLIEKGIPLNREYRDGTTPLFLLLEHLDDFFFEYCKTHKIALDTPNRFGLTPARYFQFLQELKGEKKEDRIGKYEQTLLQINQENPSIAFHLMSLMGIQMGIESKTTIRTILESFLRLSKFPVLEWMEHDLWTYVFYFSENLSLKSLLLEKFPDPPAGIWNFWMEIPKDPFLTELWLKSVEKGNYIRWGSETLDVSSAIGFTMGDCRPALAQKLLSKKSFWKLESKYGSPDYFGLMHLHPCEDEEKEKELFQLLKLAGVDPGKADWIQENGGGNAPLCNIIDTMIGSERNGLPSPIKDQSKYERNQRRILTLLKMGASPNCYLSDWDGGTPLDITALDAARKNGLKDLEKLLISYGAQDQLKLPLRNAIVSGNQKEIKNLIDKGAVIDSQALHLAAKNEKILKLLVEEYNSLEGSLIHDSIFRTEKNDDLGLLPFLLKSGFSLKVRILRDSPIMDGYGMRTSCAIDTMITSENVKLKSLLQTYDFKEYSCRGFHLQSLCIKIENSQQLLSQCKFYKKNIEEEIKNLKLEALFPELKEESYIINY
ncbi:ankyrin repeat domain-containing protein [Leptospira sp. WS92.C1]